MEDTVVKKDSYTSTTNACKLCTPLGACIAFKGIKGAISLMHGSQGCATYIRRYLISHFKEPIDIASSNFSEDTAIFGGGANLKQAVLNVSNQYKPELIGISTTCLSETIGDDVGLIIKSMATEIDHDYKVVHVSTPSYTGTHESGYRGTLRAIVEQIATEEKSSDRSVNFISAMLSPADMRYFKEILEDFQIRYRFLPDYSETLDGALWDEYKKIPSGGTTIDEIANMSKAIGTIELGYIGSESESVSKLLKEKFNIKDYRVGIPVGVEATDNLLKIISEISGNNVPAKFLNERGRLLDSYVDGHKYVFGKRCVLYGEEDFVVAIACFLSEIGIIPVLCGSGGKSGKLKKVISSRIDGFDEKQIKVMDGVDFSEIEEISKQLKPDFFIGNSKGYSISREMNIPLIRIGFPVHDRFGGSRILHTGYRGTQALFDLIVNTLLKEKQDRSSTGYSYL
ncbi:MAG: nitrogenase [Desulfobacterales bacterium]|nr:nitrogenase [Desulfobacterales bacterium]MCP4161927.1 nitrogenase [Deltaproteobacteria bacterium]